MEPIADDALPARDIGLHQSAPVVSRHPLPAHAAALGDTSQMRVALRRGGLGHVARHRARTGWDDNGRIRMTGRNLGVDVTPVEGTIAGERGHRPVYPVE